MLRLKFLNLLLALLRLVTVSTIGKCS